jgi:hypothetical protein
MIAQIRGIFSAGRPASDSVADGTSPFRPLFIVGMPRSGTSLVEQILASHTKVHGAGELDTMNKLVGPMLSNRPDQNVSQNTSILSTMEISTVRDGYLEKLISLRVPENIITDKMPLNFRWIGFILSAFPEAKIIHLNREPRATCWSVYKQYLIESHQVV